jgi:hypothetical protein
MTNEEWKEFVTIVRNNSFEDNREMLWDIQNCKFYYSEKTSYGVKRLSEKESEGLSRFLIERVLYPIGNREKINCSCGSHNGYLVEMEDGSRVYQHSICMNCDTVQTFDSFFKLVRNKDDEEEEECFVPTNGTWLSRLVQRLSPLAGS